MTQSCGAGGNLSDNQSTAFPRVGANNARELLRGKVGAQLLLSWD